MNRKDKKQKIIRRCIKRRRLALQSIPTLNSSDEVRRPSLLTSARYPERAFFLRAVLISAGLTAGYVRQHRQKQHTQELPAMERDSSYTPREASEAWAGVVACIHAKSGWPRGLGEGA
eukprot:GHVU01170702.1.p1 GENE.GHVU01170702.1~~GHVU01170702.1.p1  ORF type:complete len:118 (-),score=2.66 GHVU01170702.1:96-449(-)